MKQSSKKPKKILLLSYSFSGQTSGLLRRMTAALEDLGIQVVKERIAPSTQLRFPVKSIPACIKMMLTTFVRQRIPIVPLSKKIHQEFDLIGRRNFLFDHASFNTLNQFYHLSYDFSFKSLTAVI